MPKAMSRHERNVNQRWRARNKRREAARATHDWYTRQFDGVRMCRACGKTKQELMDCEIPTRRLRCTGANDEVSGK